MDLAQLLPKTGIPIGQYPTASGSAFAAPAQALERGGQQLEQIALGHLGVVRQAEEAKKLLEIKTEAARVKSGYARYARDVESTLRETITDPDEYYNKVLELGQSQMETELAGVTKHPEQVRAYLAPQLQYVLDQTVERASLHRIAKTKSATNARIDETVDNYMQLARQTDVGSFTGQQEWASHVSSALDAIRDGEPVNGRDATGDAVRKKRDQAFLDRAEAHERTAPLDFLTNGNRLYVGPVGAGKVALLENQARTRIDVANKAVNAEWEHFYKTVEKDEEGERKAQVDALDSQAERGQLTRQQLEDARVMRIATGEDYRRLSKALDSPDKAEKSDPDVYDPVALRAHSSQLTVPEIDKLERQVDRLKGSGITTKDALALKDRLRQNRDALVTKGDSLAMRQHQQAEQEINLMAGVVAGTITEKLDPVSKRVLTTFIPELRKRSNAYEGTEPPLAVLESMKPRIEAMLGSGAQDSPTQVASKLRYPQTMAPAEMKQRLDAEFQANTVSPGEYRAQKGYILEYDKAVQAAEKTRARLDALKGQQQKSGAAGSYRYPQPGKERKPGG